MSDFKDSVGALWLKESSKGNKYMAGTVKIGGVEYPIMIFKNDKGDNDRRPDYRIFPSKPREGQSDPWESGPPPESRGGRPEERQDELDDGFVPF